MSQAPSLKMLGLLQVVAACYLSILVKVLC